MMLFILLIEYATAFFGPNAFPVPDPLTGRVQENLRIEVAADGYFATDDKGKTADVFARAQVPLYTRYVNISLWMPVHEWYDWTDPGHGTGDVYISGDIQVLSEHFRCFADRRARLYVPDIALRVGLKTASGEQVDRRRHYDDPAYWFDASIGRSIYRGDWEFRLSGTAGFLCWQTYEHQQNDAFYYGLTGEICHRYVGLRCGWQGYSGWRTGDKPMTLMAVLTGHIPVGHGRRQMLEPFVRYQYGIRDYPYHQIRVGLAYSLDILTRKPHKP